MLKAVIDEIVIVTNTLLKEDIKSVAIMSNNVIEYPEDSFENMIKFSKKQ